MKDLFPRYTKVKIPKTKHGNVHYGSVVLDNAKTKGQDWLYYTGWDDEYSKHTLNDTKDPTGDYFDANEIELYEEVKPKAGRSLRRSDLYDLARLMFMYGDDTLDARGKPIEELTDNWLANLSTVDKK